jgi:hypothetical protein
MRSKASNMTLAVLAVAVLMFMLCRKFKLLEDPHWTEFEVAPSRELMQRLAVEYQPMLETCPTFDKRPFHHVGPHERT